MPLKKGSSKQVFKSNVRELVTSKPSAPRAKGIRTLAKRKGISFASAKRKQAVAISRAQARKPRQSKH